MENNIQSADDVMAAIDSLSGAIEDVPGAIEDIVEVADDTFDSLGSIGFEDLAVTRPTVTAKISTAAQMGKQTAASVAAPAAGQISTGRLGAAQAVSRSVAGPLHPNNLKMAALGLSLGGLGAGYAYGRTRKRRR